MIPDHVQHMIHSDRGGGCFASFQEEGLAQGY